MLALLAGGGMSLFPRPARVGSDERIAFLRLTSGRWQVWLMTPDGSKARQLTLSPVDKYAISWCSDNRVLHFYTARGESTFVDLETGLTRTAIPSASVRPQGPFGDELPFELEVPSRRGLLANVVPAYQEVYQRHPDVRQSLRSRVRSESSARYDRGSRREQLAEGTSHNVLPFYSILRA